MKDIRHLMNEKLVGNLMKPFIQYFTLPLLVQRTPTDFRQTLPFPTDSADSPSEVHQSPLDMTGFRC